MKWSWHNFVLWGAAGAGVFKIILDTSGPISVGVGIVLGSLMGIERRASGLVLSKKLRYDTRKGS